LDKAQTLKEYGPEQFQIWRRSFDVAPPRIADDNQYSQAHDERYQGLKEQLPRTECLKDVLARMMPFWDSEIVPSLKQNKTVLITAHGNSLRALIKELDGIGDQDVAELNIPTGIPLLYRLATDLKPLVSGGEYLDPEAALAGAKAVANQGKK
jgi:2,3-bisphosphoglycerate-dependent phosphoglycerate mutase